MVGNRFIHCGHQRFRLFYSVTCFPGQISEILKIYHAAHVTVSVGKGVRIVDIAGEVIHFINIADRSVDRSEKAVESLFHRVHAGQVDDGTGQCGFFQIIAGQIVFVDQKVTEITAEIHRCSTRIRIQVLQPVGIVGAGTRHFLFGSDQIIRMVLNGPAGLQGGHEAHIRDDRVKVYAAVRQGCPQFRQ